LISSKQSTPEEHVFRRMQFLAARECNTHPHNG
jgi:hypothetical protein